MSYQPTAAGPGERVCVDRWEAIRRHLATIPEPFNLLDLGANAGWFSARAADEFDCRVTAIDNHPDLPAAASERVTVVHRRVDAPALRQMARHDVVLALSVIHHMRDWRQVLAQVRACRRMAFVEIPHPGERWMRYAAGRHELAAIHAAVAKIGTRIGSFERIGRDGSVHQRPMFAVGGTVRRYTGTVFAGSGTCSRQLRPDLRVPSLDRELGYKPYAGSLNLRCGGPVELGRPWLNWPGIVRGRRRPYWFWPAWVDGMAIHAMIPGTRVHGPDCIELVAPDRLRDRFGLTDGDLLTVDIAHGG